MANLPVAREIKQLDQKLCLNCAMNVIGCILKELGCDPQWSMHYHDFITDYLQALFALLKSDPNQAPGNTSASVFVPIAIAPGTFSA